MKRFNLPKIHWLMKAKITTMVEITEQMKGKKMIEYNGCTIEKNYDSLTPLSDYLWGDDTGDNSGTGISIEHCQEQIDQLVCEGVI